MAQGDTLTYTFMIQNRGNTEADAASDVVVTDVFDPALTAVAATLDGAALTEGTDYTYDAATGTFASTTGRITVPAATFTRADDGTVTVTPGMTTLQISGTVQADCGQITQGN